MWRMREAEWEREARARQKLMAQVLWSILVCAVHRNYVALFPDPTQFSVSPTVRKAGEGLGTRLHCSSPATCILHSHGCVSTVM